MGNLIDRFTKNRFINDLYQHNGDAELEQLVRKEVAKHYGVSEKKLPGVSYTSLPHVAQVTPFGAMIIGKIMGAYDRIRKTIRIDGADYSRMDLRQRIELIGEEIAHAAQDLKGKMRQAYGSFGEYLKNYTNDLLEREAKEVARKVADKIINKYGDSHSTNTITMRAVYKLIDKAAPYASS